MIGELLMAVTVWALVQAHEPIVCSRAKASGSYDCTRLPSNPPLGFGGRTTQGVYADQTTCEAERTAAQARHAHEPTPHDRDLYDATQAQLPVFFSGQRAWACVERREFRCTS